MAATASPLFPAATGGTAARDGSVVFGETFLRKLERLSVVAKRVMSTRAQGERHTRRAGSGIEFTDHRSYVPGDDLRRLDWNLYGRMERLLVRMFDEDEDLPVYLLVDASASMAAGAPSKFRLAAQTAAALAYVAWSNLDRVALYPVTQALGGGIGPVRGKAQIHPVLSLLGALRPEGRTDLRAATTQFLARHRRRGVTVILSDFYDPVGYEEAIDRLRYSRFEPVVVQIHAPEEAEPELRGDLVLVDMETGAERELTVTPAVRDDYRRRFDARLATTARFCRQRAIPYFSVRSDHSFEDLVLRLFRAGGVLR